MKKLEFENMVIHAILENGGEIRASELEKTIMKKTEIVHSTFYKRLAKLIDKGFIVKDIEEGKKRWGIYRLNYEAIPKERLALPLLKWEILSHINDAMQPLETKLKKGKISEIEILEELGSWIGELSLWALLKQVETGEPFTEVVHFYLSHISGAQALLRRKIVWEGVTTIEEYFEKITPLTNPRLGLEDREEYQPAIKSFEEALKQTYPRVKKLEALYAKVCEGKSEFKQ